MVSSIGEALNSAPTRIAIKFIFDVTEVKQIAEEAYTYAFPMLMGPLRASPMMDTIHKCYLLNQGCSLLHIQCIYFQRRGIRNRKQPLSAYGSSVPKAGSSVPNHGVL